MSGVVPQPGIQQMGASLRDLTRRIRVLETQTRGGYTALIVADDQPETETPPTGTGDVSPAPSINEGDVVHITGAETIIGDKTFDGDLIQGAGDILVAAGDRYAFKLGATALGLRVRDSISAYTFTDSNGADLFSIKYATGKVGVNTTQGAARFTVQQSATSLTTSDASTYAILATGDASGTAGVGLGSDSTYSYIQSFTQALRINAAGQSVLLGGPATAESTLTTKDWLYAEGNVYLGGNLSRSLYTWNYTDPAWRLGSAANSTVNFTRKYLTSQVQYATYAQNATQGWAVGQNGGLSALEVRGSDNFFYVRGITQIENTLNIAKPDGTLMYQFDPALGQITLPSQSLSGDALIDGTVTSAKLSGVALKTSNIPAGTQQNGRYRLLRYVAAANNTTDSVGQKLDNLNAINRAADGQAYGGNAARGIAGTTADNTAIINGPYYGSDANDYTDSPGLAPGYYRVTVFSKVSSVSPTTACLDVTATCATAGVVENDGVRVTYNASELNTTYVGASFFMRLLADTRNTNGLRIQAFYRSAANVTVSISHLVIEPADPMAKNEVQSTFIADAAITNAKIYDLSATKLTAGIIQTDDISLGAAGKLWAGVSGATKDSGSRLVFQGGGTNASRGIFGWFNNGTNGLGGTETQTIRLSSDGTFQLRGAGTASYVNLTPTLFQMFYNNTAMISLDASTGDASFTGGVTATSGSFGGWLLNATTLTSTNNRVTLGSAGYAQFNSGIGSTALYLDSRSTDVISIYNSGNSKVFYADSSGNVTMLGTVTATSGYIGSSNQGFTINSTSLTSRTNASSAVLTLDALNAMISSGSTTDRIAMQAGQGIWAGASTINSSPPFSVTTAGYMRAVSGIIGGWTIGSTTLTSTNVTLDSSNSRLQVGSSQKVVLDLTGNLGGGRVSFFTGHGSEVSSGSLGAESDTTRGIMVVMRSPAGTTGDFSTLKLYGKTTYIGPYSGAVASVAELTADDIILTGETTANGRWVLPELFSASISISSGASFGTTTVSFNRPYTGAPHVFCQVVSGAGVAIGSTVLVTGVTSSSATIRLNLTSAVGSTSSFTVMVSVFKS